MVFWESIKFKKISVQRANDENTDETFNLIDGYIRICTDNQSTDIRKRGITVPNGNNQRSLKRYQETTVQSQTVSV